MFFGQLIPINQPATTNPSQRVFLFIKSGSKTDKTKTTLSGLCFFEYSRKLLLPFKGIIDLTGREKVIRTVVDEYRVNPLSLKSVIERN